MLLLLITSHHESLMPEVHRDLFMQLGLCVCVCVCVCICALYIRKENFRTFKNQCLPS